MGDRFNPRLTGRGWRVVISILALLFASFLYKDTLLLGTAAVLVALTLVQLIKLRMDWLKAATTRIEPPNMQAKIIASETFTSPIIIHTPTKTRLTPQSAGFSLHPSEVLPGETGLMLSFKSTTFGEYKLDHLHATLLDQYNVFESTTNIPLMAKISVYPKTTQAVIEATRFLAGDDVYNLGDEPTRFVGSGFEYADTRPYIRGDSLRRLDWKATARLNTLMVKDYFIEGGTEVQIIFDGRAPDPISHDELTEALVRTALSYSRRNIRLGLTTIGVDEVKDYAGLQPFDAVAVALKIAFEENRSAAEPAYELLDPQSSGKVKRVLQRAGIPITSTSIDAQRYIGLDTDSRKLLVYISALQGDPLELLNLISLLRAKGWEIEVLQPTRPWLNSHTLEESKRQSDYYAKLYRALDRERVKVEINAKKNQGNI